MEVLPEHKSPVAVAGAHVDYGAPPGKELEEGEGFVGGDGAAEVVHEDGEDVVGHAGVGEDDFFLVVLILLGLFSIVVVGQR